MATQTAAAQRVTAAPLKMDPRVGERSLGVICLVSARGVNEDAAALSLREKRSEARKESKSRVESGQRALLVYANQLRLNFNFFNL